MDHISKALEKTKSASKKSSQTPKSVRDWVRPGQGPSSSPEPVRTKQAAPEEPVATRPIEADGNVMRSNKIVSAGGDPYILDRYRLLRTRTLQLMRANQWQTLGITSAGAGEGKTLTSINLAMAIAREGVHPVVLLDADIRRPAVANAFGYNVDVGLPEVLIGEATLEDVAFSVNGEPNLSIVPGKASLQTAKSPELLSSKAIRGILSSTLTEDTILIVDLPPVLVGDDVIGVAPELDSMLMVVAEGQTDVDELTRAVELLSSFNLLGTVLNRSTEKVGATESYYGYYKDANDAQEVPQGT